MTAPHALKHKQRIRRWLHRYGVPILATLLVLTMASAQFLGGSVMLYEQALDSGNMADASFFGSSLIWWTVCMLICIALLVTHFCMRDGNRRAASN